MPEHIQDIQFSYTSYESNYGIRWTYTGRIVYASGIARYVGFNTVCFYTLAETIDFTIAQYMGE